MVWLVPLQPCSAMSRTNGFAYWSKPYLSSTKVCRPVKFEFEKKSTAKILEEVNKIEYLNPKKLLMENTRYTVTHKLPNGEVIQAIFHLFVELNLQKWRIKFCLGQTYWIQVVNTWIRSMECILYIPAKYNFWLGRQNVLKKKPGDRKKKESSAVTKQKDGTTVNISKQGVGTSNEKNTPRRSFWNCKYVVEIIEVGDEIDLQILHYFTKIRFNQ